MKKVMVVLLCVMVLGLNACSSFEASIGAGYRKCPPGFEHPILPDATTLKAMGMTPGQWEFIFDFLMSDSFKVLFPESNRVDLGIWTEIRATK